MKCRMDGSTGVPLSDFRNELKLGAMAADVFAILNGWILYLPPLRRSCLFFSGERAGLCFPE